MNIPLPKFNIDDKVSFIYPSSKNEIYDRIVIAKVQFIYFDECYEEWYYRLHGWSGEFSEYKLKYYFPKNELTFNQK